MSNETVLITGASSGIGLELASLFAADGSDLVLVARSAEKLEELAAKLRQHHSVQAWCLPMDLARPDAPQELFDRLQDEGVTIDVLVNNAGFGALGRVTDLQTDRQLDMLQVNVTALTHLTRLFLPQMIARGHGGLLNIGSTASFQPGPNMAVYYATKAYVLSFTEGLAVELAGTGVSVSCLCPGPTATNFGPVSGIDKSPVFRMTAMNVARVARAGYRGLRRSKTVVVPGLLNKFGAFSVRLVPRSIVRNFVKLVQQP